MLYVCADPTSSPSRAFRSDFFLAAVLIFLTAFFSGCGVRVSSLHALAIGAHALESQGGGGTLAPIVAPPTNGLLTWVDASDPTTLFSDDMCTVPANVASGDPVGCWTDKSGNARDAWSYEDWRRPVAVAGAMDGHDALLFDGNDDFLWFDDMRTTTGGFHLVIVSQRRAASTGINSVWQRLLSFPDWSSGVSNDLDAPGFAVLPMVAGTTNAYTPEILEIAITAGYKIVDPIIGMNGRWWSENFSGEISEVLIYDHKLSTADRTELVGYLQGKYPNGTIPTTNWGTWTP